MNFRTLLRLVCVCTMFRLFRSFRGVSVRSVLNPAIKACYCPISIRQLTSSTARETGAGLYIPESSCEDDDGIDAEFYEIDVHEKHSKTEETVLRHILNFKKWSTHHEIKQHTQEAYEEAKDFVNSFYGPLHSGPQLVILDSGCGVGLSSFNLGKQFPDTPVIGIDRSENRLTRRLKLDDGRLVKGALRKGEKEKEKDKEEEKGNVKLVRADLVDFWALVYRDEYWQIHSNYLLYPNPYPKSQHLKRRWHGHPVFPILLGLGGNLIVRSNWNIYCEEFLDAVKTAAFNPTSSIKESLEGVVGEDESIELYELKDEKEAITHFEKKYVNVGVKLYQFSCNTGPRKSLNG